MVKFWEGRYPGRGVKLNRADGACFGRNLPFWSDCGQIEGGKLDHYQTWSDNGQMEGGKLDHYQTWSDGGQMEGGGLDQHQTWSDDGQIKGAD